MNRLFGQTKPRSPQRDLTKCIAELDRQAVLIKRRIDQLNGEFSELKKNIKGLKPGSTRDEYMKGAMRILKQRKLQENLQNKVKAQSIDLQNVGTIFTMLQSTRLAVDAMRSGLKKAKKAKVDPQEVEDLTDDLEELFELNGEVHEAIGVTHGLPDYDEADVEAEFEVLSDQPVAISSSHFDDASSSKQSGGEATVASISERGEYPTLAWCAKIISRVTHAQLTTLYGYWKYFLGIWRHFFHYTSNPPRGRRLLLRLE